MPTELFSWGYWGWGNATPRLVEAVDAAEAARGFGPPLFVDIRISRSVRAVGFRDGAFATLLGERYVWMPALGNRSVATRSGPPIQIAAPEAAHELLDRGVACARDGRRLLFFCSCERPFDDAGAPCHRVTVAELVRAAAAERSVEVRVAEWPGGTPETLDLELPGSMVRAARRRRTVPLPEPVPLRRLAGLPWGSRVRLRAPDVAATVVSGPVKFQGNGWCLPVLRAFDGDGADVEAARWAEAFRRAAGYESNAPPRALSVACVYTIAHADKLRAIHDAGGSGVLTEKRPWASARRVLDEATARGFAYPVVFADAADCTRLLFWAVLTGITVTGDGTSYAFEGLQPVAGHHTPQELLLQNTGEPIAPNFIRPYALCRTPTFLAPLPRSGA